VAFREVAVIEIREVLRCWLGGQGLRTAAGRAGVDRKTARRYVDAAVAAGLVRDGGEGQLSDELLGAVVAAVRPARRAGHGQAWEALLVEEARIRDWIERDQLVLTNIHGKLTRSGVVVPYRTLHRFATERCRRTRRTRPGPSLRRHLAPCPVHHPGAAGAQRPTAAPTTTRTVARAEAFTAALTSIAALPMLC
jgi:hypothetical protein